MKVLIYIPFYSEPEIRINGIKLYHIDTKLEVIIKDNFKEDEVLETLQNEENVEVLTIYGTENFKLIKREIS